MLLESKRLLIREITSCADCPLRELYADNQSICSEISDNVTTHKESISFHPNCPLPEILDSE